MVLKKMLEVEIAKNGKKVAKRSIKPLWQDCAYVPDYAKLV